MNEKNQIATHLTQKETKGENSTTGETKKLTDFRLLRKSHQSAQVQSTKINYVLFS
jgi:hypothetical protein